MPEPAINFAALGGVDLDRLERCLQLHASRLSPGRYRVDGGEQTHWVDLYTAGHAPLRLRRPPLARPDLQAHSRRPAPRGR